MQEIQSLRQLGIWFFYKYYFANFAKVQGVSLHKKLAENAALEFISGSRDHIRGPDREELRKYSIHCYHIVSLAEQIKAVITELLKEKGISIKTTDKKNWLERTDGKGLKRFLTERLADP